MASQRTAFYTTNKKAVLFRSLLSSVSAKNQGNETERDAKANKEKDRPSNGVKTSKVEVGGTSDEVNEGIPFSTPRLTEASENDYTVELVCHSPS